MEVIAALLILIVLAAGFQFTVTYRITELESEKDSDQRFYLRVAFYGLLCLFISFALLFVLFILGAKSLLLALIRIPITASFGEIPNIELTASLGLLALVTYGIGCLLPRFLNLALPEEQVMARFQELIEDDELEKLIQRSASTKLPISITLETRKVYIGWCNVGPYKSNNRRWISVAPIISGYRKSGSHDLVLTTFYTDIYDSLRINDGLSHLSISDFSVSVKVDSIVTASLFDIKAYEEFSAKSAETEDGVEP